MKLFQTHVYDERQNAINKIVLMSAHTCAHIHKITLTCVSSEVHNVDHSNPIQYLGSLQ